MSDASQATKELEVQEKRAVPASDEPTVQGRFYTPLTDIYETADALILNMELPGVEKSSLSIEVERDQLSVQASIALNHYAGMKPLYSEYGIGHFARRFRLSNIIDRDGIRATLNDGVLVLTLPKVQQAATRTIAIQ